MRAACNRRAGPTRNVCCHLRAALFEPGRGRTTRRRQLSAQASLQPEADISANSVAFVRCLSLGEQQFAMTRVFSYAEQSGVSRSPSDRHVRSISSSLVIRSSRPPSPWLIDGANCGAPKLKRVGRSRPHWRVVKTGERPLQRDG